MPLASLDKSRCPSLVRQPPPVALIWVARAVALAACVLAGYLLWASVTSAKLAGCSDQGGIDCEGVLSSRWSTWLSMPVGVPALVVYLTLLVALLGIGPRASGRTERDAWRALIPLATLAAGAGSWFCALQLFELQTLCPYCLALHGCGMLLAVFVFWYIPLRKTPGPASRFDDPALMWPQLACVLFVCGLIGVGVLIGGQLLARPADAPLEITQNAPAEPPPPANPPQPEGPRASQHVQSILDPIFKPVSPTPVDSDDDTSGGTASAIPAKQPAEGSEPASDADTQRHRLVVILGGKATVDAYQSPILGSPGAATIIVEMFDYTCHHCRELHHLMQQARERYGSRLAIVLLPNPMNTNCNRYVRSDQPAHKEACPYAQFALAVWNADPTQFEAYHEWLMEPKEVPSVAEARSKAAELIGESVLEQALADKRIGQQIEADGKIYDLAGHGTIPKLMTPRLTLAGKPKTVEELFEVLETKGGLRP